MLFKDRSDAGMQLAHALRRLDLDDPVVLALPRGGIPVGYEVAREFGVALDVLVVRKIGAPGRPELGVGAIAEGGEPLFDQDILGALRLGPADVAGVVQRERGELQRRVRRYRGDRGLPDLEGRDVVVVDDGLATGGTARAALQAVRDERPRRLVLAVPVCAAQSVRRLEPEADDIVCVRASTDLGAVGQWYEDFRQTADETVTALLERSRDPAPRRE